MQFAGKYSDRGLSSGLRSVCAVTLATLLAACGASEASGEDGDSSEAGSSVGNTPISSTVTPQGTTASPSAAEGHSGRGGAHGSTDAGTDGASDTSRSGGGTSLDASVDATAPVSPISPGGPAKDASAPVATASALFPKFLTGTNLSGAEFGTKLPGIYDTDYTYPTHAEVDHFTSKGMSIFRFPFLWERLQPTLGATFNAAELARLKDIVSYATSKGAYAILNPQNFARYNGKVIGDTVSGAPTAAQFASFWGQLAEVFSSDSHVVFGLMNEPNTMKTELWLSDANAAIQGIRQTGATNVIFVPGNGWTGAYDWTSNSMYGTANGTVLLNIVDPLERYAFEVHQYNDSDSSGNSAICTTPDGSSRLKEFTNWLIANHKVGFLGEFATSTDPSCAGVIDDTLAYLDANRDVWLGWTWWSAGPWWGNYMFTLEPVNGVDQPQMADLLKHL